MKAPRLYRLSPALLPLGVSDVGDPEPSLCSSASAENVSTEK